MLSLMIILIIIAAVLIIGVILLQPGKGDLTATFGGISSQMGAVFGMQKAGDILSKTTKVLAVIILLLVLLTNKFFVGGHSNAPAQQLKPVTQGAAIPAQPALAPPPAAPMQQQQQPQQEQAPAPGK
jgi:preprotein translocase subunit SecG